MVQVVGVQRFEARGSLSLADGVKGIHILPFVPSFAQMVARLEQLQEAVEEPPTTFLLDNHPGALLSLRPTLVL